jgi:hypothetical protein
MRSIRLFAPIVTWHDSWASSSRLPWRGYRRGILRGRFPTISPLVDTANVLAAERLIPIGLFDLDRIQGAVELTLSTPGEAFASIGQGEPVALPDGTPVLRDALGVFSAIGTRDSARTRIVADTTDLLVVSWGVSGGRRDADRRHAGQVRRARPSRPMSDAFPSHPAPLMSGSFCSSFGVRSWLPDAAMIRRG